MNQPSQQPPGVNATVEHLFRQEAGRIVATLTGIFGLQHLALAEDVVQEALARALQTWPFYGLPDRPAAWIMRTARNLALDALRREANFRVKTPEIIRQLEAADPGPGPADFTGEQALDDQLRLMFVCCHPRIPSEARVPLALKTLCGFSGAEIARAFLTTEAAIAKRLTRAKQKIREEGIRFELPAGAEMEARLDSVLQALYLWFNEGYKASVGERLIREEVCAEAIRLARLLASHPAGDQPKTHALLALMLLTAARAPARVDDAGNLLRLREQDRSQWNQCLLAQGCFHLTRSAAGGSITPYHVQAGIAACHGAAKDYAATDWPGIVSLYDRWLELDSSPVVALNRAVALAEVSGPRAALAALHAIPRAKSLQSYYLWHAVRGDLAWRSGERSEAAACFQTALTLAPVESERRFLADRLETCRTSPDEKLQSHVLNQPAGSSLS